MTQPEREAREMRARRALAEAAFADGCQDRTYSQILDPDSEARVKVSVAVAAMLAFAGRPTAGIDREEPVAYLKSWKATEDGSNRVRVDRHPDCEPWLAALNPTIEALYRAPAKTGERGAVIEECARVVETYRKNTTAADHIAAAIRALSQPLPDAPIVSGEGS